MRHLIFNGLLLAFDQFSLVKGRLYSTSVKALYVTALVTPIWLRLWRLLRYLLFKALYWTVYLSVSQQAQISPFWFKTGPSWMWSLFFVLSSLEFT